jgi:hypothetical protein
VKQMQQDRVCVRNVNVSYMSKAMEMMSFILVPVSWKSFELHSDIDPDSLQFVFSLKEV